jgi:hypothetical protein
MLLGWVDYFAHGHASRCFSYVRDWVEKKVRRHLSRNSSVQESRVREIRTHGSIGRESETDSRRRLTGHEAGNGGHGQVDAYGAPRRLPTLPSP